MGRLLYWVMLIITLQETGIFTRGDIRVFQFKMMSISLW